MPSQSNSTQAKWAIFCRIVDNFGDIGVCWRLARQLAYEYGLEVNLFVDDLTIAQIMMPSLNPQLTQQRIENVMIHLWREEFTQHDIADVVIEAFGCELPLAYLQLMAQYQPKWINLEYLSAESWVEGSHLLPSPHPQLPLVKHFFFPGFSSKTGGLIREQRLMLKRSHFQADANEQNQFWHQLGINHADYTTKVSLFCYPHAPVLSLMSGLSQHQTPVLCVCPYGAVTHQLADFFDEVTLDVGACVKRGNLTLKVMPFLSQSDYDQLLWACDLNFVRGEDSWIRAIWAARPFIWQPYQQDKATTALKLNAFLSTYFNETEPFVGPAMAEYHHVWLDGEMTATQTLALMHDLSSIKNHAKYKADELMKQQDLATNLYQYCQILE